MSFRSITKGQCALAFMYSLEMCGHTVSDAHKRTDYLANERTSRRIKHSDIITTLHCLATLCMVFLKKCKISSCDKLRNQKI